MKLGFTIGRGQRPRMRQIPAGAVDRLADEIARAKVRFGLLGDAPVVSCYEAGREGFWLHRYLVAQGVKNAVVDSSSIEVNRRARRAKTDGLDLAGLLRLLVVASHEALEMVANPFGNMKVPGDSPMPEQGRVEFLVEVCDPCQDDDLAYTVNGVLVSDFYTPRYFDPVRAAGVRYSFSGAITGPREVLTGGYLSWQDVASGDWFQEQRFTGASTFKRIGPLPDGTANLRVAVDAHTPETRRLTALTRERRSMQRAATKWTTAAAAARAQATRRTPFRQDKE